MANNIIHLVDGQNLGEPRNWQELEITFDFLEQKEEGSINTNALEFVLRQKDYIRQRLLNGLTGGVGIFEGIPYQIQIGQPGNPAFTFDGYIDGSAETTFIGDEEVTATIKKRAGDDWLNDVADGFSFAFLYSIGEITNADFKKIPYVINYVPDGMQMITLQLSLYMMTKELIESVRGTVDAIAEIVNAATPTLGTSVGAGAGVVTAWNFGDYVRAGVRVAAQIIYQIALTVAIKELMETLLEQIYPKQRTHLGMSFRDLIKKGVEHLGLTYQSTLLDSVADWVYMPTKDRKGGEAGEVGYPSNSDPIYTLGDAIRLGKEWFNADYKIVNGVFRFEREDFWQNASNYILPNVFNDQTRLLNQFLPNTSEFVANYNINYAFDRQDQNTLDDVTGLSYQAITKPKIIVDKKLVNMKGLTEIKLPFALGKRKDRLTDLEKFGKTVFGVVDSITGIFGGGTNFKAQINGRIGCMLLSSHFITVPKIVILSSGKLAQGQRELLGARVIWEKFHKIKSFAEIDGHHNQWLRFPPTTIPVSESDLISIFGNNFAFTADGKKAMIEKMVWKPYKDTAVVSVRVNEKYTENLKIIYLG